MSAGVNYDRSEICRTTRGVISCISRKTTSSTDSGTFHLACSNLLRQATARLSIFCCAAERAWSSSLISISSVVDESLLGGLALYPPWNPSCSCFGFSDGERGKFVLEGMGVVPPGGLYVSGVLCPRESDSGISRPELISRMYIAATCAGRSRAIDTYSSRSCSPESPNRINLAVGKLSRISTIAGRFRSAGDSNRAVSNDRPP